MKMATPTIMTEGQKAILQGSSDSRTASLRETIGVTR